MKIAILGFSGSGKSTLARKLGDYYGIEVLHLDRVHWLPGWQERELPEKLILVKEFMDTRDAWVIEGNYSNLLQERRLEEADMIVILTLNPLLCYLRVRKRLKQYCGTSRPDMTEGCNEKVDLAFAKWVLYEGRTKKRRSHLEEIAKKYAAKTTVITTQAQLARFTEHHRGHV